MSIGQPKSRQSKFGKDKKVRLLELLELGYKRGVALVDVGISRQTLQTHMLTDPEFKAQVEQAELDACEHIENAVYQMALGGNLNAAQMWLYNRSPQRWKDRKQVEGTAPLQVNIQVNEVGKVVTEVPLLEAPSDVPTTEG